MLGLSLGLFPRNVRGLGVAGGHAYLLNAEFPRTWSNQLANPRISEPGPGTLTITDTNNKLSIAAGKLSFATGGVGASNPGAWGAQLTRAAGRAVVASGQISTGAGIIVGWDADQSSTLTDAIRFVGGTTIIDGGVGIDAGIAFATNTTYYLVVIQRGTGFFAFIKGGAFVSWTLIWVGLTTTSNHYPGMGAASTTSIAYLESFRVLDLPAPFATDYGLATQRLAGAVSAGTTFVHEANCVIEWVMTTLPSAGLVDVRFRMEDVSNCWRVLVGSDNSLSLQELVAGTPTTRGSSAAGVIDGHRIVVVADGTTIRVYSNNVLRITYASASNFATETDGKLQGLATGGAVSDIVSWPRTLTGATATLLDDAANGLASTYLLNDEFTTTEGGALPTPYQAEAGQLTVVDTGKGMSIAGGSLVSSSKAADNNPSLQSITTFARLVGRTFVAKVTDNGTRQRLGFYETTALDSFNQVAIFDLPGNYVSSTYIDTFALSSGTVYTLAVALRASGAFFFIKGGSFSTWTLVWVDASVTTATMTAGLSVVGTATRFNVDFARVLDLPAPFSSDYGLATQQLAGAVTVGTTFTHEANCVIEFTVTTLPVADVCIISFRQQDADNKWYLYYDADGGLALVEKVATVDTARGSVGAGTISAGHRIVVVADGTTIRVYSNNVLRITYSSASNFATETDGIATYIAPSAVVSDIISWPRTLSTDYAAILDSVSTPAPVEFLLRDDFTTALSAPVPSPRVAGNGILTLVQTDGQFSISGGKLNFPAQATPNYGDQGFYGAGAARVVGRVLIFTFNESVIGAGASAGFIAGWATSAALGLGNVQAGMNIYSDANVYPTTTTSGGYTPAAGLVAINTDYKFAFVLASTGYILFVKGGTYANWTFMWRGDVGSTTTLYPFFTNYNAVGTLDTFRVKDLSGNFLTDYGIATQRLVGARTAGETFVHEANCVIEFVVTTLPSGANGLWMSFRKQSTGNAWSVGFSSTGGIQLYEVVSTVATLRGSVSAVVANGHRVVVIADGSIIRVYSNNVLRITYSSASNFATATSAMLDLTGDGSVMSDIISWPRTFSDSSPEAIILEDALRTTT